ncbi:MAG TPA: dienelactone hydrolase family protein [Terriglobales bacterium]|nr:dienelactone hydrolase family protein [Terriglobales bacterium]
MADVIRSKPTASRVVRVPAGRALLEGNLNLPANATGIVLFVHGSGSSRYSPRNRHVAEILNRARLATLLFDLLMPEEEEVDEYSTELRFDIPLLSQRVVQAIEWTTRHPETRWLRLGCFGASTGAAAALVAAAELPEAVQAVVSRGGRPDLAGDALGRVRTPTLLIVGGADREVLELNRGAMERLQGVKELKVVPGATHLFEEPGALDNVAGLARDWFLQYLAGAGSQAA